MARVRVSDFIAHTLAQHGVRHVFMLTGGGAMHLNDAFGREPRLQYVCCHHEQALAMAAESYYRMSNRLACVNVTTGPGGLNALNGVFGAWTDSIGMVVVSGQVKRETMIAYAGVPLRQLGDQEADIVSIVRPMTKMAEVISNPEDVRCLLEKALHLASTGRPGPVWLDVPIDVQAATVDPEELRGFDAVAEGLGRPYAIAQEAGSLSGQQLRKAAREVIRLLRGATRPVVLAGMGVRLSGAYETFKRVIDRLAVPTVGGWNAYDVIHDDHACYAGRPSSVGDRAGNFTVQNADFLLVLGSRLNIRQVSYNYSAFAPAAYKVMIDIDTAEMRKPTLSIDLPIHADLAAFLPVLLEELEGYVPVPAHEDYLKWCHERRRRYPVVLPEYWATKGLINPYCFVEVLSEEMAEGEAIVTADGTACVVPFQALRLKPGQRLYTNSGCASMGYELPAAIGAWHSRGAGRVTCIAGDGSIMQNIQELQTISGQKLPIKIFLFNNSGYHSIRQSQQAYFPDNVVGCGPDSGVTFPDFEAVSRAFGIPHVRTTDHADMRGAIRQTLEGDGPRLCEVMLDKDQAFSPKLSSRRLDDGSMVSSPLEDLAPFLSREELAENMIPIVA